MQNLLLKSALFVFLFIIIGSTNLNAQRAQSIFIEGLGLGGVYSLNYDTRFEESEHNDGLGFRIGGEVFEDIFIIPVQLNYLIGSNGKYLEIGTGASLITGVVDFGNGTTGFKAVPTAKIGYRSQPLDGGFTWSISIITLTTVAPVWGGVGIGYAF